MAVVKSKIVVLVIEGVKRRARLVAHGLRGWRGPLLALVALVCFLVRYSDRIAPGWITFLENLRWEFVDGDDDDDEDSGIPWADIPGGIPGEDEDVETYPCGAELDEALLSKKECECSWDMGEEADFSVKYYFKDGKLRADITSNGGKGYYIYRDLCRYGWGEEKSYYDFVADCEVYGAKQCFSSEEEYAEDARVMIVSEGDIRNDCQPATVDESLFELPEGIDFVDYSRLSPQ